MTSPRPQSQNMVRIISISLLIICISYIFNYTVNVFFARWLHAQAYGDYAVTMSSIQFASTFVLLGSDSAALRYIPEYISQKKWAYAFGYLLERFNFFMRWGSVLFAFGLISAIIIIVDSRKATLFSQSNQHHFFLFIWVIPLFAIANFLSKLLRTFNRVYLSSILSPIVSGGFFVSLMMFISVFILKESFHQIYDYEIVAIYSMAILVLLSLQYLIIKRNIPSEIFHTKPEFSEKEWNKTGFDLMVSNLVAANMQSIILIILEIFDSHYEGDVGVLSAIFTICSTLWLSYSALSTVISPAISPAAKAGDTERLQYLIKTGNRITFSIALIIYIIFVIFGKKILHHFGAYFQTGYEPLLIIAAGYLYVLRYGTSQSVLQYSGQENVIKKVAFISVIVTILLGCILCYCFGIMGAAFTLLVLELGITTIYNQIIKKRLGIYRFI